MGFVNMHIKYVITNSKNLVKRNIRIKIQIPLIEGYTDK